jgi:hypothetical protein
MLHDLERQVWGEARAMTRREVIIKAIGGQLSWVAAADIIGITPAADAPDSPCDRAQRDVGGDGAARRAAAAQSAAGQPPSRRGAD